MAASIAAAAAGVAVTAGAATAADGAASFAAAGAEPAGEHIMVYSGTARDPRSGAFLYGETHVLQYRGGLPVERAVLYTCRNGAAFARKTVTPANALLPDFTLEDATNGMRAGVRTQGTERQMFFRSDRTAAEKSGAVAVAPGLVADTGFDAFVRANWQALVAGQSVSMDFLLPSRLSILHFKVKRHRDDQMDGVKVEVFRLGLTGMLGLLVPSIDVYYGTDDHRLMRYVGLSDLRDFSGGNYQVDILFPASERKAGDASSMTAARRAALDHCPVE